MKILFLDCDGTIREPKSGAKFISSPTDQQPIPGASTGIDYYHKLGYTIIGITNQGGVAAGHKSLEDAIAEQRYTLEIFPHMEAIIFCPDYEGQIAWWITRAKATQYKNAFRSSFRKPGRGMIELAVTEMLKIGCSILKTDCEMVGDRLEDEQCADAAGIKFTPTDLWINCYLAIKNEHQTTGNIE